MGIFSNLLGTTEVDFQVGRQGFKFAKHPGAGTTLRTLQTPDFSADLAGVAVGIMRWGDTTAKTQLAIPVIDLLIGNQTTDAVAIRALSTGTGWVQTLQAANGVLALTSQLPADSGWLNLTLVNSWVYYGASYSTAQYRKIGNVVYLKGCIKSGTFTDNTTLFTLPAGYRPPQIMWHRLGGGPLSGAGMGNLNVTTGGVASCYNMSGNAFVSLDGLVFAT